MAKKPVSSKEAFNASKSPKSEIDDPREVADRDVTKMVHKPPVNALGNNAPMGAVVQKQPEYDVIFTPEEQPKQFDPSKVDLTRNDITVEDQFHGLNVMTKIENEPFEGGIDGGKISRLTVTRGEFPDEDILAHYENGEWQKDPDHPLERQAVMEAKERDNGLDKDRIIFRPDKDNDPDLDR